MVARKLSEYIELHSISVQGTGPIRRVTVEGTMPDGLSPTIRKLLEEDEEVKDVAAETRARLEQLEALRRKGKSPEQDGGGEFRLVREGNTWGVLVGWDEAVVVKFEGAVKVGLPWDFYPVQKIIRAMPGKTLQVLFKARNRSVKEFTGKARHVVKPQNAHDHLIIVQCFCFIQTTLEPGEEKEMLYIFRIGRDAPRELQEITVLYEWYPIEHFQKGWEHDS